MTTKNLREIHNIVSKKLKLSLNDQALLYEYLRYSTSYLTHNTEELDISHSLDIERVNIIHELMSAILDSNNKNSDVIHMITKLIDLIKFHQKNIEKKYIIDRLTGLFNFTYLNEIKPKLEKDEFNLFFFDINGLKLINDTCGHIYGNKIIIEFSKILKKSFRMNDYLFRYGGDEFIAIIIRPKISPWKIFERINDISNDCEFSFSLGWANNNNRTFDETLVLADKEMYKNKGSLKCKSIRK